MTTSGLSPDAKEFIPLLSMPPLTTIPLYVDENIIASVYTTEPQQQRLIYPLIKVPEIEFHIPSSTNDNPSQIVLLPPPGCYPGTPMSSFYPIDYPDQSFINYSMQQPKSNRISAIRPQRGSNHSANNKRISRGINSRPAPQKYRTNNDDESSFQLRADDFPSLPMTEKIPTPLLASIDTELV
jgi:hypothetical protein